MSSVATGTYANTVVALARKRAADAPGASAYIVIDDGKGAAQTLTYAELDTRARVIAAELQTRKLTGQRALLLYPPGCEYISAFLGCLYAGVAAVPAYPVQSPRDHARLNAIAGDASAAVVCASASQLESTQTWLQASGHASDIQCLATDTLPAALAGEWLGPNVSGETLAFLQYTSGSTGDPKGVMVTHANLLHNLQQIAERFGLNEQSRGVVWLPPYHDMGLIGGVLGPLYVGFPVTLMSPLAFLKRPLRWLQAITETAATVSGGPNFAYELCLKRIADRDLEKLDLKSWRVAFNGAEAVRAETLQRFADRFAACGFRREAFLPCYGMAEGTLFVTGLKRPGGPAVLEADADALAQNRVAPVTDGGRCARLVECGTACGQTVMIVDPQTKVPCASNEIGEVWVRGASVAHGYWQKPLVSAEVFHARLATTQDGPFMRTGDLGFLHKGDLYLTGRLKELIIADGRNIYPQDIERTVQTSYPGLRHDAGAAFSIEVDGNERMVVVQEVERKFERDLDANAAMAAVRQAIAEQHGVSLHAIALIKQASLPKTTSGKIQRRATRDLYLRNALEEVARPAAKVPAQSASPQPLVAARDVSVLERELIELLAEQIGLAPAAIDPAQPFNYYGLDSKTLVGLAGVLEQRLDCTLPATTLYDYPSISALARHLTATRTAGADSSSTKTTRQEPVAVVGMGCRFPGGGDDPDAFWRSLLAERDAVVEVPDDRAALARFHRNASEKLPSHWGAFLQQVDEFDAAFFNIAPREAVALDPQQRLLLEVSWEALENAGIAADRLAGSDTGVFIGISTSDYARIQRAREAGPDPHSGTGNALSIAANRISYLLDLRGPSLAVDTACSSSLTALHLAARSLEAGECDLALAGGVNLIFSPELGLIFSQAGMIAPDGHCKTFDATADGYVRGEGCGVVVLKRLADAVRDGDTVLAVVRGSAVNQDGRSNGLTAPNGPAQEAVMRKALERAGVAAAQIDYVECHGTGTALGDPIEVQALARVYGEGRSPERPLLLGSVKTNIGHLEPAAGIAGFIKVVLGLRHGVIPAHKHFSTPNPRISWQGLPVQVVTAARPWPRDERCRGGVSSFGFGGTNAHVIVEEAPAQEARAVGVERPVQVLALSAKSAPALAALAARYVAYLEGVSAQGLGDICYTANTGRAHFAHRLVALGGQREALVEQLREAAQEDGRALIRGQAARVAPKVGFLFTGQGSQYAGMGRELYDSAPVFRQAIDRCAELLQGQLDVALSAVLWGEASAQLNQTRYTQPALFAIEYALATLWQAWGIKPAVVMGHSVGEVVAACIAGVFSLEDGLKLIAARGRFMDSTAAGAMLAVLAAPAAVQARLVAGSGVVIAAQNGPANTVIAGPPAQVQALVQVFGEAGIETRALAVTRAFHSPSMEPILAPFEQLAREITYHPARLPVISNETGALAGPALSTPEYWVRHILAPVRFADGMQALQAQGIGVYLEVGPGATLLGMGRRCLAADEGQWLASLRPPREEWAQVVDTLARLYVSGVPVDWAGFDAGYARRRAAVPTYPFQRQRYWFSEAEVAEAGVPAAQHALLPYDAWLGYEVHSGTGERLYLQRYTASTPFLLRDHRLHGTIFLPAAAHAASALAAAQRLLPDGPHVLENLAIDAPLELADAAQSSLQYAFAPEGERAYAWRAFSRADTDEHSKQAWQAHASGRIVQGQALAAADLPPEALQGMLDRCPQSLEREALYERFAQMGYGYGPTFRGIAQLRWNAREAIARIELETQGLQAGLPVSPAVLDACFQAALFAALGPAADAAKYLYVPVGVDRLQIYGQLKAALWCHCTLRDSNPAAAMLVADMRVYDEAGKLLAQIDGLCGRRLAQAVLRNRLVSQDWFYEMQWMPQPLPDAQPPASRQPHSVLIFADSGGLGEQLALTLGQDGTQSVCVYRGEQRGAAGSRYDIDPASGEDWAWLLGEVADRHGAPGAIVYLWGQEVACAQDIEPARLLADQRMLCGGVVHLVQALQAMHWAPAPRLWLITSGAQALVQGGAVAGLSASSLWGLGRTLDFEHEELRTVRLDLDPALRDCQAQAAVVHAELQADGPETQIAYRAGRHVPRLAHAEHAQPQALAPVAIRADATYLISGGLGSLGLVFARWLVAQGARHLGLLGRKPPTGAAAAALDSLRAQGARVEVLAVDVADERALSEALHSLAATLPPLAGVIHAAGVLNDGLAATQQWADFESVLAPKVLGAWNLHRHAGMGALDFFVLFSSAASLIGSAGQGAYAAANAFLDALAWHRRSQGLGAISINWGPWAAGMAADSGADVRLARSGISAITPAQGALLFEHILARQPVQVGVMSVDWTRAANDLNLLSLPVFKLLIESPEVETAAATDDLRRTFEALSLEQRKTFLIERISERVTAVMGLNAALDPSQPLQELGLDSLMAVELRNDLARVLGRSLPATLLFDYPSIDALTAFILTEFDPAPTLSPPDRVETLFEDLAEIEQLSDQEIEQMLGASPTPSREKREWLTTI